MGVSYGEAGGTAPAAETDLTQVSAIRDREVVKRTQQVGAQGVPESQLRGRPTVEEAADVQTVCSFGCCGESEKLARFQMIK